jgi:rhamnogalacturonan endolyase
MPHRSRERAFSFRRTSGAAALEALEHRRLMAFGVTNGTAATGQPTYVVDNGGDLKFSVINGGNITSTLHLGDVSSIQYKGKEMLATYAQTSRYSHYEQGLGSTTIITPTVDNTNGIIVVKCDDSSNPADATQYYILRRNDNNIYMASLPTDVHGAGAPGEGRFIAYLSKSVFTPEAPSDNTPHTASDTVSAIEGSDVFGHTDGAASTQTTSSKFYNMGRKMIENVYHGLTGTAGGQTVGAWMFMGNREHSAGGPFMTDIDYQSSSSQIEIYNCIFTGHTQTEPYRQGLHVYSFQFTNGSLPATPDYSFMENLNLAGWVPASQRGTLTGTASGVPSGHQITVGLANTIAQYWGTPNAAGQYTIAGIQAGTYTETLYDGELEVGRKTVTVNGGATTNANIADTFYIPSSPIFRIGTWDGTPIGFSNTDIVDPTTGARRIEIMHPSDVRMTSWTATPNFVVGTNTDADWPSVQFMGVNNSQRITFNLTSAQVQAMTMRIGITWGFSGARPKITVNAGQTGTWTSTNPTASADLNSRGITRGTWRGVNQLYTYNIPSSAFHTGTNTIDLPLISGSFAAGQTWLSPNVSYDAIDLVPTSSASAPAIASVTVTPASSTIGVNGVRTFTAVAKDANGNAITANIDWSATLGTIDPNGNYIAPATGGTDTITATASTTRIPGYSNSSSSSSAFTGTISATGSTSVTITPRLQVSSGDFQYKTQQAIVLTFNRAIDPNLLAPALSLTNAATNATAATHLAYSSNTATLTFDGVLPDGNYQLTIPASATLNSTGEHLASDYTLGFFVLTGDANHDGSVNTTDFAALAQSFNKSAATYDLGDFNYDGTVNALDFNALATMYGSTASAAPLAEAPLAAVAPSPSLFSAQPIPADPLLDVIA